MTREELIELFKDIMTVKGKAKKQLDALTDIGKECSSPSS